MTETPSLRVDIYSSAGVKLDVPPLMGNDVLSASYGMAVGRIGQFSVSCPADCAAATGLANGRQLWIYRGDEGLCFKGQIDSLETQVTTDGRLILVASGFTPARVALGKKTTLLGRQFSNSTLAAAVTTLLTSNTFSSGTIDSPSTNVSIRFDGNTLWDALYKLADVFGLLMREDNLAGQIDISALGTASGVAFRNLDVITPALVDNPRLAAIGGMRIKAHVKDIYNTVIPLGQQTGIQGSTIWFNLADSNRSSPYTIQGATGPDGNTYYYISDSASVTAYGTCEYVYQVTGILPASTSATDKQRAANTLYDDAVNFLQRHKDEQVAYEVDVVGLQHIVDGAYAFEVGDTVRLQYRGVVEDTTGARVWKEVDEDLYLMEYTRSFDASGADSWRVVVSTIAREAPNDGNITAQFLSDIKAVKAAPAPFVLFGDNVMRLDESGIQLASDSVQLPALYFLNQHTDNPGAESTYMKLDGLITPTSVLAGMIAEGSGGGHSEVTVGVGANSDVLLSVYDPGGVLGTAYLDLFWQSGQALALMSMDKAVLRLASLTADPAGTVMGDGNIWYRSDTDKLYARINGTSVDIGGGAMKVQNDGYEVYPAAAAGITCAASGSAWSNSAWVEAVASTGSAIYLIGATFRQEGGASGEHELDIGVGAAAAEVVKSTLPLSVQNTGEFTGYITMLPAPLAVASGARIAVRQRGSITTKGLTDVKLLYVEQANLVSL